MATLIELHATAMGEFDRRVRDVGPDDWGRPTPCAEWTVRDLVDHLVTEQLWVPHLLGGARVKDVGDRFEGDQLGDDPVAAWSAAAHAAREAWLAPYTLERTVHLSHGDVPGEVYLWEMTFDLAVHAWDLARALGVDERLDPVLVSELRDWLGERGFGPGPMFDAPVAVGSEAAPQDRLIALTGRKP
ncbi:TIGR03086 family metal-binding protein [Nocardiopsis sp. FIRDI 009]|uniref:TIGR03086 family metal-binding protein n=1 Tax=Nocardiopsis sp. FIRDI 009 TaxID=714197 RepID=UPI000E24ABBA|nr:TIGR03086 family metal-binding protein [Nocardiopsis sp. FIRDI 009]